MKYTNSSLATVTILSPNHYSGRYEGYAQKECEIYITTPHCMAYDGTVESCGNVFKNPNRNASSNYGIGSDGRIGMYVEEKNGSWCSSNKENDLHAITVEIACKDTHPYVMTDKAIESYINLTVDVMKRYGLTKLTYLGSLEKTQAYTRANDEMIMTLHRFYAAKSCPGDYFISKIPYIVSEINKRVAPKPQVRLGKLTVVGEQINIRKEPNANSNIYKIKKKGDVINVVSLVGKWYVTINGNYVYKDSRTEYKPSTHEVISACKLYNSDTVSSSVLRTISAGTKVLYISDNKNGWSKVWYDNKTGYVKNSKLKNNAKLSTYPTYKVLSDAWLRKSPSLLPSTKVEKLKKGTTLTVKCLYSDGWYLVSYKDKEYYVRKSKLGK